LILKSSVEVCDRIGATPEQAARHNEAVKNFFAGAGLRLGHETKWPEYIKGWEDLVHSELDRWERDEPTLIRIWGEALFDIIDQDGNGSIDIDEWRLYTKCAGIIGDDADCQATFDVCDIDGDGKIDIEEMTRQHLGFWYTADPKSNGLYGKSVP